MILCMNYNPIIMNYNAIIIQLMFSFEELVWLIINTQKCHHFVRAVFDYFVGIRLPVESKQ